MTDTYVLGISCFYHDSSATLVKNGKVVCAVEEERLSRKKHDNAFPVNAINYCLFHEGISMQDLATVAFYEIPSLKFHRYLTQHMLRAPFTFSNFKSSFPSWIKEKLFLEDILKTRYNYGGPITHVKHHIAHAASAFYPSGFESAAFVTLDGVGEWDTTMYGVANKNIISPKRVLSFPHSLGLLYSTLTSFLGFSVNDSEYKVMGLAAYGNHERTSNIYYKKLLKVIDLKEDGSYHLVPHYFDFFSGQSMFTPRLNELLGVSPREASQEVTTAYKDIATAVQLITEDVALQIFNHVYDQTKETNLVFAGGIALNSVLNGKILSKTPYKNLFIQPAAGDSGGSLGAAFYAYYGLKPTEAKYKMEDVYLGPFFSNEFVWEFLQAHSIKYQRFESDAQMITDVAKLILENNVVGWFQGRMEWGPRALGARSILANPCNPDMQNILNLKIKHREEFRPFAPAVCIDDVQAYFECDNPMPDPTKFMLMVYPVREKFRTLLPSITHVDGSGRLQVVARNDNVLYYDLIKEFGKLSGIPIIVNTSFNIRGEPIVCTPKDAYYCMMGTELDYLVMGSYLIKRSENVHDIWSSKRDYLYFH